MNVVLVFAHIQLTNWAWSHSVNFDFNWIFRSDEVVSIEHKKKSILIVNELCFSFTTNFIRQIVDSLIIAKYTSNVLFLCLHVLICLFDKIVCVSGTCIPWKKGHTDFASDVDECFKNNAIVMCAFH